MALSTAVVLQPSVSYTGYKLQVSKVLRKSFSYTSWRLPSFVRSLAAATDKRSTSGVSESITESVGESAMFGKVCHVW